MHHITQLSSQQTLGSTFFWLPSTRLANSHLQPWLFTWLLESIPHPQDVILPTESSFQSPIKCSFKISSLKYIFKYCQVDITFFSFKRNLFPQKHLTNYLYLMYCHSVAEDSRHTKVPSDGIEVQKSVTDVCQALQTQ